MYSPEVLAKINLWRSKAAAGTLSADEVKEAVLILRGDRKGASIANEKTRAKSTAVKVIPSADDLLNEMGDM